MQLFGLKACDTCRKALKQLPEAELVDVRADGVPEAILTAALAQFGDRLVNTRSTTWRGLSEAERAAEPLDLLKAHPALMKRPLIKSGDDLYLGWDAKTKAALGVEG
ncbi:arsenate reductase [Phaeobacter inhibens]|uniref:arsenate reductase family protein n=1 Tax=Phaeobacter inhibens TaxID=221822 RepID=UPI0021A900BE|nr:ArsC/Spx/MgsR family protein [Phaeobacter inhibens]UWR43762.1 arsenate reductase [Phaeobacter inhibens]UWR91033.1 arsenate reductase [Phaeobacter inhibens]